MISRSVPVATMTLLVTTCVLGQATNLQAQPRRDWAEKIEFKRDVPYAATDNPRQTLDLMLPKEPTIEGKLPVIVFIHGGGWRAGNKATGTFRLAPRVATGKYAGVTIAYRLSGEAQWPAQAHDCKAAIRWIRGNAEKHNLDTDRIAVWGSSAGGHLVSILGTTGGVEALEGELGEHNNESSRVTCVVNYYGPADLGSMNDHPSRIDHLAADSPESRLLGATVGENLEKAKAASPQTYVTEDDAPHLIVHGTKDQLVPYQQSVVFDKKLDAAGVPSTLIEMTDGGHGFRSEDLDDRVSAFFARHLHDEKVEVSDEPIKVAPRLRP